METQNYKRTLAGSVGAGMGAIMNGSGRTYFVLEHKSTSKYHQAGETQKIIVDQIELGRAASCQVRYDESFETVSRKHAAIERDGENWKLIHLSQSNPTLVNGRPINGTYYLQSGDEIQLSVGGPRLGFIIPQGRQALTSSIGMTERMNLFRKQALRPYKTALTVMSIVFVLAIAGLVVWNINQKDEFDRLIAEQKAEVAQLEIQQKQLEDSKKVIEDQLANNKGNAEQLKAELNRVNSELGKVHNQYYAAQSEIKKLQEAEKEEAAKTVLNDEVVADNTESISAEDKSGNASNDLKDYYDHIYTIKIDRIEIEKNGKRVDPGIQLSDVICGTGFVLEDGTFVTDRQNIQPWVYSLNSVWKEDWRHLMAQYVACGANVIIHYRAYSTKGTGRPLSFVNTEFVVDASGDTNVEIEIEKSFRSTWRDLFGFPINIEWGSKKYRAKVGVISTTSRSFAYIRNKGVSGEGIPYNIEKSGNMSGGTDIHMVGYARRTEPHALVPAHFNDRTNVDDTLNGTIVLQGQVDEAGYYGSPAFHLENNQYKVVGVMVGSVSGRDRLVPIKNILLR